MTVERLREALRAVPFRPFTVLLADGRSFRVAHPEFVLLPPRAERTFVLYDASSRDPERYVVLDLLLVTGLEFANGRPRRRAS